MLALYRGYRFINAGRNDFFHRSKMLVSPLMYRFNVTVSAARTGVPPFSPARHTAPATSAAARIRHGPVILPMAPPPCDYWLAHPARLVRNKHERRRFTERERRFKARRTLAGPASPPL